MRSAALETGESCRAQQTGAVMSCSLSPRALQSRADWLAPVGESLHKDTRTALMALTKLPPTQHPGPNVGQGVKQRHSNIFHRTPFHKCELKFPKLNKKSER